MVRLRDLRRCLPGVRRLRLSRRRRRRERHRLDVDRRGRDRRCWSCGSRSSIWCICCCRLRWRPTASGCRRGISRGRAVRARGVPRLASVFLVVLGLVVGATLASALAWSGVGLIAFVPLVGLAVVPLQLAALMLRGLAFEYIGLDGAGRVPHALSSCAAIASSGRTPASSVAAAASRSGPRAIRWARRRRRRRRVHLGLGRERSRSARCAGSNDARQGGDRHALDQVARHGDQHRERPVRSA